MGKKFNRFVPLANKDRIFRDQEVYLINEHRNPYDALKKYLVRNRVGNDQVRLLDRSSQESFVVPLDWCNLAYSYGWHSRKASEMFGFCHYLDDVGRHVPVTMITHSPKVPDYNWDDKVFVGIVFEFVRRIDFGQRLSLPIHLNTI